MVIFKAANPRLSQVQRSRITPSQLFPSNLDEWILEDHLVG